MSEKKGSKKLEKYKARLYEELSNHINSRKSSAGKKPKTVPDGSGMDMSGDIMDREMDITIKEIMDERHIQIRDALKRIEEGSYGTCLECDKPIDRDRLEAIPEATLCINCQKQKERHLQTIMDIRDNFFPDQLN